MTKVRNEDYGISSEGRLTTIFRRPEGTEMPAEARSTAGQDDPDRERRERMHQEEALDVRASRDCDRWEGAGSVAN
jgi:hypothetical protein